MPRLRGKSDLQNLDIVTVKRCMVYAQACPVT